MQTTNHDNKLNLVLIGWMNYSCRIANFNATYALLISEAFNILFIYRIYFLFDWSVILW